MREGINPQIAVGTAHDLGFTTAVLDTFQWIRQGLAYEPIRIVQHIADCYACKLGIIELQYYIRQKDAFALTLDYSASLVRIHTHTGGETPRLIADKRLARLSSVAG